MERDLYGFIIQKGRLFMQTEGKRFYGLGNGRPLFTQYVFDAMMYRNEEQAKEQEKKVGGRVRMFDRLNGDLI